MTPELFHRYDGNPVLHASNWPVPTGAVFNPAAVQVAGEMLLLVRVEARSGRSHLAVATSADGLTTWAIDEARALHPDISLVAERYGIEDPRITELEGEYVITYTGYSELGPLVCVATTKDFRTYKRHGVVLPPENKDAAYFPRRFDGQVALIHRPVAGGTAHIWIGFGPDLVHIGEHAPLMLTGPGGHWDGSKIGLGPPPLETDAGWLICFHGVRETAAGAIYRVGLALLDLDDPRQVIARSENWVLGPREPYERVGDVGNVVFPCGWTVLEDGDTVRLYYGAADTCVCVADASLRDLLAHLSPAA